MSAAAALPVASAAVVPPRATHTRIVRRTNFRGVDVDVEIDLVVDSDRVTVAVVLCDVDVPAPLPQLGGPLGLVRSRRMVSSSASSNS